jgi:hypothetical protein
MVNRSAARGGLQSHAFPKILSNVSRQDLERVLSELFTATQKLAWFNIYFVPGRRERAKPEETNAAVILCILQLSKLRLRKGSHFVIVTQPERNSTEPEFVPGQLGSRALVLVKPLSHTESYI